MDNSYVQRMAPAVQAFVKEALPFSHWGMKYFEIRLMEYALVEGMFGGVLSAGGSRALDFGCGLGLASVYLSRHFDMVEGVDLDHVDAAFAGGAPAAVRGQEIVERLGIRNVTLRCGDTVSYLATQLETYDFIFSHFVLEHVENIDDVAVAMADALKPGGRAVHIVPNTHDTINQLLTKNLDPILPNAKTAWRLRHSKERAEGRFQGNLFTPITHSEFLSDYRQQFEVNSSERYLFPMLRSGLVVRDMKPLREHAYGILVEKPM